MIIRCFVEGKTDYVAFIPVAGVETKFTKNLKISYRQPESTSAYLILCLLYVPLSIDLWWHGICHFGPVLLTLLFCKQVLKSIFFFKKKSPYKKLKTTHVYQISWLLDVSLVYIYGDM